MRKWFATCAVILFIALSCSSNTQADQLAFYQKIDQLIENMPIDWDKLNKIINVPLTPVTSSEGGYKSSLTQNVTVDEAQIAVILYKEKPDGAFLYFEFSGTPCYSPTYFIDRYFKGNTPTISTTDGISKVYRLSKPEWGFGMFTAPRNGQECIMSLTFRGVAHPDVNL